MSIRLNRFAIALLLFLAAPLLPPFEGRLVAQEAPAGDRALAEADRLIQQGNQQILTSQYRAAIQSYQAALALYQQSNVRAAFPQASRTGEANALMRLGIAYDSFSQYQQAIDYFQQALLLFQALQNRYGEAMALMRLGSAYDSLSQYQQAIEHYQQALPIFQVLQDRNAEAVALHNLGAIYRSVSQYQQAIEYYQQALPLFQALQDRNREAVALNNLGIAYDSLSQYQQAIEHYQQALPIFQALQDRSGEADALMNLGSVYLSLNQYQQAIEHYQQALPLYQAVQDRNGEAGVLNNLGVAYRSLGQYQQAIEYYQQTLPLFQTLQDYYGESNTLMNLGNAYRSLRQYQQAIEYYQQALPIFQALQDRNGEANLLGNLGLVYGALNQDQQAIDYFQQSLPLFQAVGDRSGQGELLANIGYLLEIQEQPELAIVFYKQSVNVRESIRADIQGLDRSLQQSYAESIAADYRRLVDLLLEQDRILEAQEVLDLLKLQELDDYLRDVRGNEQTAQGLDFWPAERAILDRFNQWLEQDNRDFNAFIQSPEITAQVVQLQRHARGQTLNPDQLVRLQDNLQQLGNAALLYPLILDDRLELVLVTPSGIVRKTVAIDRPTLNELITAFRQDLNDRHSDPRPNAQQLYDKLIAPIAADLEQANVQTILYAADSQLRYVPLAALHDGDRWLTERYAINHITAASLTNFNPSRDRSLRILAGAFSDASQTYRFEVGDESFSFNGLPYAGKEVEGIAAEIDGTRAYFDRQFTPANLAGQMNNFAIVHLATHAAFVPGTPEESFILFGNGDRVNLRDLSSWSLPNVDLFVLSACQTAVSSGELGSGAEILGFGYQMQRIGVEASIASLWSVSDGGTQVLMEVFYTALSNGYSKTEALQRAQQALITDDLTAVGAPRGATVTAVSTRTGLPASISNNLSHPYYWAPFILIGNGL